jgi:hypothetical protein
MNDALRRAVAVAVPAWLVSRLLALVSLLIAGLIAGGPMPQAGSVLGAQGIWAWDAQWYRSLAAHGYLHSPRDGQRFFPLFPLLGRWLGAVLGGHDGLALVLLANLFALGFGIAVVLLVEHELDAAAARTSAWLTLLAPGAVVLTMAYAEPLSGLLGAVFLLLVRRGGRGLWWATAVGVAAGLTRPTGFLLAVVPVIELVVRRRRTEVVPLLASAAAPVVGAGIFCAWAGSVYGDVLAPFHAQSKAGLRGGIVVNPVHALLFEPNHAGLPVPLRVLVVATAVVLVVLTWRTLPPSIAAWATLLALAAMTSSRLTSLPRYLSGDFPLLIALATRVRGRAAVAAVAASAALFVVVAVTGFGGATVL